MEIETGKSDAIYNIRKNLEARFEEIIIVALDDRIKEKILFELKDSGIAEDKRIEFLDIYNFS